MKRIIQILPSILIGTSLVSPILCVASCSTKNPYQMFNYTFDDNNKSGDFEPNKRCSLQEATPHQAREQFYNDLLKDKSILADEIVYFLLNSNICKTIAGEFNHANGFINVGIGNIDAKNEIISIKIDFDLLQDGKKYASTCEAINIPIKFFASEGARARLVPFNVYLNYLGVDANTQHFALLANRTDWILDIKLNPNYADAYWKRLNTKNEWIGASYEIHIDSKEADSDNYCEQMTNIPWMIFSLDRDFWYMSDVKILEK